MGLYAYFGHPGFIDAVAPRIEKAGFTRVEESSKADLIITFCTSQTSLEDLYFGDGGIVADARPGTCVCDISATMPSFATEMNAVCTVSDLHFLEAPLCVANKIREDAFARENLSCFLSSETDVDARAMSVLDGIFSSIQTVEQPGAAQLSRAALTLQNVSEMIAVIESHALFESAKTSVAGIATEGLDTLIRTPGARSVIDAIHESRYTGQYTVEMLMNELSCSIMSADDYDLILPGAEAAFHLLELLCVIGGSDLNPAALNLVYGPEGRGGSFGLDWSRAEQLYSRDDEDDAHSSHKLDDEDTAYLNEAFGQGFNYSAN